MPAPLGKPSPEGSHPSGSPEAMAIEDADTNRTASDVPINDDPPSPSERSRSDKREVNALVPRGANMPHSDTTRFSHRGCDFHASQEGMPASSNHMQMNRTEIHNNESSEMHNTLNLSQAQNNLLHVNSHGPAITLLV